MDIIVTAWDIVKECGRRVHKLSVSGQLYCNTTFDQLSCWPATSGGQIAVIPCFSKLRGIPYDTTKNASRLCYLNGTWEQKSDYSNCTPLPKLEVKEGDGMQEFHTMAVTTIYYVGYSLSLISLIISLWIFLYFKSLRCLRNTIHCNLFITYILADLTWMVATTVLVETEEGPAWPCRIMYALMGYFQATNFFWMFVEGLYLYTVVVRVFSSTKPQLWTYVIIGWGFPVIIILICVVIKWIFDTAHCWILSQRSYYDYVFIGPILLVLFINFVFLTIIMRVLITKLRASNNIETKQYRKAAKGLLILLPLLGLTYVLVIVEPTESGNIRTLFTYMTAILVSIQGFSVSILYCFLNAEVKGNLTNRLERWKLTRSVGSNCNSPVALNSPMPKLSKDVHEVSLRSSSDCKEYSSPNPIFSDEKLATKTDV